MDIPDVLRNREDEDAGTWVRERLCPARVGKVRLRVVGEREVNVGFSPSIGPSGLQCG